MERCRPAGEAWGPARVATGSNGVAASVASRAWSIARVAVIASTIVLAVTACRREEEDPTVRQSRREATITAEVRSRLLAVEALRELPLAVVTRGSQVSVAGQVRDSTQVETVREIAGRVRGVERVTLDVRVVPAPPDSAAAEPEPRRRAPIPAPAELLPSLEEAG